LSFSIFSYAGFYNEAEVAIKHRLRLAVDNKEPQEILNLYENILANIMASSRRR